MSPTLRVTDNLACGGALCASEAVLHPLWQTKILPGGTGEACRWGATVGDGVDPDKKVQLQKQN
eukprot:1151434-Pelagomonas_calceolata.AAC.3